MNHAEAESLIRRLLLRQERHRCDLEISICLRMGTMDLA